jgi:large subunit ribosomal protein L21
MFAVIKTGGKQYSVAAGDTITVMALEGVAGDKITFGEVLLVETEGGAKIGAPLVAGASVTAEIAEQARGPKTISFKKRRRQNSKRKRGHRQDLTIVRITGIEAGA